MTNVVKKPVKKIIHVGVGPDRYLKEKDHELKDYIQYYVDPGIPPCKKELYIEASQTFIDLESRTFRIPFEEFLYDKLKENAWFFYDSTLICERVIEHLQPDYLMHYFLPLLINLATDMNMTLKITYPEIKYISDSVEGLVKYLPSNATLEHNLLSIECIAFGEHKSVLSKEHILSMFAHVFKKGFNVTVQPKELDKKCFYNEIIMSPDSHRSNEPRKQLYNKDLTYEFTQECSMEDYDHNIGDMIFRLHNMILSNSYDEISYNKQSKCLFSLKYIDIEKLYALIRNGLNVTSLPIKDTRNLHIFNFENLYKVITREGFFNILKDDSMTDIYNTIDPLYNVIRFQHCEK